MAVFLVNNCTFQGCGLTFSSLADLIQHIEDTHIETDPQTVEKQEVQQPTSLALSYILKYYTDAAKREQCELQKKRLRAHSPAVSLPESTPTGSEVDEEEIKSENENSDDSWTTQEEFPSEVILSMMGGRERDSEGDRPYACPVPGCKKRYKNVNGIKYHARHGHKKESKVKKTYKCICGKSYKSAQGLRNHSAQQHVTADFLSSPAFTPAPSSLSRSVPLSPPDLINARDTSAIMEQISLTSPSSLGTCLAQLTSTPSSQQPKVLTQVKTFAMAANKVQSQQPAALTLPIGTPVRFITQSIPAVPVPMTVRSIKVENSINN